MADLVIPDLLVSDVIDQWPQTIPVFIKYRLGCVGCFMAPFDTLADVAKNYDLAPDRFMDELHRTVNPAIPTPNQLHKPKLKGLTMEELYKYIHNLTAELPEIPPDTIVSRTLYDDEFVKAVIFGFAPGQELSEHTASQAAVLYFVEGSARLTLGMDEMNAEPGTWAHMTPRLAHRVHAETRVVMLLLLLKKSAG